MGGRLLTDVVVCTVAESCRRPADVAVAQPGRQGRRRHAAGPVRPAAVVVVRAILGISKKFLEIPENF